MTDAESKPQVPETAPEDANKPDGALPPLNIFLHWCKGCNICIAFCLREGDDIKLLPPMKMFAHLNELISGKSLSGNERSIIFNLLKWFWQ